MDTYLYKDRYVDLLVGGVSDDNLVFAATELIDPHT